MDASLSSPHFLWEECHALMIVMHTKKSKLLRCMMNCHLTFRAGL